MFGMCITGEFPANSVVYLVIIVTMCIVGEFTPDNQQRVKHEEDKEHTRLDKWKARLSYQ